MWFMSILPKRKNPYWVAMNFLSVRERSYFELFDKLKTKKFPIQKIKEVLADLKAKELINDRKFTKNFISHHIETRPEGRILLKKRLFQKRISSKIVEEELENLLPREKELELALLAAKKKQKVLGCRRAPQGKDLKSKISFFLAGRGFSYDIIEETIKKIKPDNEVLI